MQGEHRLKREDDLARNAVWSCILTLNAVKAQLARMEVIVAELKDIQAAFQTQTTYHMTVASNAASSLDLAELQLVPNTFSYYFKKLVQFLLD